MPLLSNLPGISLDFLTLMSTVWNDFALPIGGLLTAIFVGWAWRVDRALEELLLNSAWFPRHRSLGVSHSLGLPSWHQSGYWLDLLFDDVMM